MFLENFLSSYDEVVGVMLNLAEVSEKDIVYDIGSGNGKILQRAAQPPFNARNLYGIEIEEFLAYISLQRIRELNLQNKVKIIKGDVFDMDLSSADAVTVYQSKPANEVLRPKLEKELSIDGWMTRSFEKPMRGPAFKLLPKRSLIFSGFALKLSRC